MGGHIVDLGKGLDSAVRRYNDFVGSLEQSVMPQARRFNELEVDGTQDAIAELRPIEASTRQIRGDRDLVLHPSGVIPLAAAERAHPAE
jgi:DNA recombination protein RmuC